MKIETIKKKGFAISLIAFPVMLLIGFLMHPHLLKFEALQKSGCDEIFEAWKNPRKQYEIIENGPHGKLTVLKSINKIQHWISAL